MGSEQTFSEQIAAQVAACPGVEVDRSEAGELAFKVGPRGSATSTASTPRTSAFRPRLARAARAGSNHVPPVFPGKTGPAARRIDDDADVRDVVVLLRLNYERIVAAARRPGVRRLTCGPSSSSPSAPRTSSCRPRYRHGPFRSRARS